MKFFFLIFFSTSIMASSHPDFVSLGEMCPKIRIEASYSTMHNFTGEIVAGYMAKKAYLAKLPAAALCEAQKQALKSGLAIKVFDGYRPVKSVKFFVEWAQRPETNPEVKKKFYPKFTRRQLFENGYIAAQSGHSRGSSIDLTLLDLKTGKDLDMGSGFDYFDTISHTNTRLVTDAQRKNRMILKDLMESHGFTNYSKEWWHYSYRPEPFPNESFDFDIE